MSRAGRDDEREPLCAKSREAVNYPRLARESPTLQDYQRELSTRGVTSESVGKWQKAMTAWQAVEASRQGAWDRGDAATKPPNPRDVDYAALAHQFRHRRDYERHLVREFGLKPGTKEWEKASSDYSKSTSRTSNDVRTGRRGAIQRNGEPSNGPKIASSR